MYPIEMLIDPPRPTYPEYDTVEALASRLSPRFVDPAKCYRPGEGDSMINADDLPRIAAIAERLQSAGKYGTYGPEAEDIVADVFLAIDHLASAWPLATSPRVYAVRGAVARAVSDLIGSGRVPDLTEEDIIAGLRAEARLRAAGRA
jgi:hypothetical protein